MPEVSHTPVRPARNRRRPRRWHVAGAPGHPGTPQHGDRSWLRAPCVGRLRLMTSKRTWTDMTFDLWRSFLQGTPIDFAAAGYVHAIPGTDAEKAALVVA